MAFDYSNPHQGADLAQRARLSMLELPVSNIVALFPQQYNFVASRVCVHLFAVSFLLFENEKPIK